MKLDSNTDFARISKAIDFIFKNQFEHPSLEEIASSVNLSAFHFQRLFTQWSGVTPKQFQRFISLEYAKSLIKSESPTLFDVADKTGLTGTGRLHDLFVDIEAMTPGEYKRGGQGLVICYHKYYCPFGKLLIASTEKGICWLGFDDADDQVDRLYKNFPNANMMDVARPIHDAAVSFFHNEIDDSLKIRLHVKGTNFQLKVWNALLSIPEGRVATYSDMSVKIGQEKAARAIGSAVGRNPVAFLIPCHRVIRSTGELSGYMWGIERKRAMLGWEGARRDV